MTTLTEEYDALEREFDPESASTEHIRAINLLRLVWGDIGLLREELESWQDEFGGHASMKELDATNPNRPLPEVSDE
jgi:hypothetical protein